MTTIISVASYLKFKRTIFKSGNNYRIMIPIDICKTFNIKDEEEFVMWMNDSQSIMENQSI